MQRLIVLFFCMPALIALGFTANAAEPQIKIAQPGKNITIWTGWNVDAKIYLKIDSGPGKDCIQLWWIKMGVNSDTWEVCDQAEIGIKLPLIYGELRAGHFLKQTAIAVSDIATVAYSRELCGSVIDC